MLEEMVKQLWEASETKRICRIRLHKEPLTRTIEPYGVCETSKGLIVLVCWQRLGFTEAGGTAGFRNLNLEDIEELEVLEEHFQKRDDFNSQNLQYKEWVYHI